MNNPKFWLIVFCVLIPTSWFIGSSIGNIVVYGFDGFYGVHFGTIQQGDLFVKKSFDPWSSKNTIEVTDVRGDWVRYRFLDDPDYQYSTEVSGLYTLYRKANQ